MRQGDEVAGRYRLDELQGQGPMSEVWRAHDDTLDRTIALKIISPTADLGRFRREAQVLATLAHENVMRVYDYGEGEAGPFMALEWLPGGTLEDRLAQGPLPPDETRRIATGMAAGLAHLHTRGLVHRDLKPANVLFDEEGRPKLGDFGLARTAGSGTLTEAGMVLGTASYISPEQAVGEPAGAASDVYSFGVILFRMLTGALPFLANDALALMNMHRNEPPPEVETLQPDAPPELAALTAAALRKDPAQRPADGAALLSALGAEPPTQVLVAGTEATQVLRPPPEPPPEPPPARRFTRRSAALIAAAVVLLALGGGLLAWAVTRPGTPAPADISTSSAGSTQSSSQTTTTQAATSGTTTPTTHQTATTTPTTRPTVPATTVTIPTSTPTTIPSISTPTTTTLATTTTATGTP